jgi:hypothetical protein
MEFSSRPTRSHVLAVRIWLELALEEQRPGGELQRFVRLRLM